MTTRPAIPGWYSVAEAARALGVSRQRVYVLIDQAAPPITLHGGRLAAEDLQRLKRRKPGRPGRKPQP